jgi:hypothetical protein
MTNKLKCTRCGGPTRKDGTRDGRQRYVCKNKACALETSRAPTNDPNASAGIDKAISRAIARDIKARSNTVKRYVITAAQNATPVHRPFLEALHSYCEFAGAELIVVPIRYANPTSVWSQAAQSHDWWAEEVIPFLTQERAPLGDHMVLLGDIKTQPTASRPLDGFETISGPRSAIIAHPKLELMAIPTPSQRLPKLLTTTGAVTVRNYIDSKAGKKGEFHHTFGAAVVEVTPTGGFHLRQINAVKDGSFHEFGPDGVYQFSSLEKPRRMNAEALVMGDTHARHVCPQVDKATFGKGGMIDWLGVSQVVWHDLHDGETHNHHNEHNLLHNYVMHHSGNADVLKELRGTFAFLADRTRAGVRNIVVDSNHPRWLGRWVNRIDPRKDLQNVVTWAETLQMMAAASRYGAVGPSTPDPFVLWAKRLLPKSVLEQTKFLNADESYVIKGIEVGLHGDKGANGAKGSLSTFAKIGVKSITGDAHSPGIQDGAYRVGTSTPLVLSYTGGPSSWLNTHCVIYSNGKRSLINVIDGNWKG